MDDRRRKGRFRFEGWFLQFITAFGLSISVTGGFFLGHWVGKKVGGRTYTGVIGALIGLVVGLTYLTWLAARND